MAYAPKYRKMVEDLTRDIESGALGPGDRLPSTSELCAAYNVSATVVSQVVLVLGSRGLIEGVPGVGRFVR